MPRYSDERRQAVVTKLLPPHALSPHEIAAQEGISLATVYKWRKEARVINGAKKHGLMENVYQMPWAKALMDGLPVINLALLLRRLQ